jgi:hypothetical protein
MCALVGATSLRLKITAFGFLTLLACAKGSEIAMQDVVILNSSPAEADPPDASSSVVTEPSPSAPSSAAPDAAAPSVVEQIDTPSASAAENLPATAANAADAATPPPNDAGAVPATVDADAAPPADAGVDAAL